MKTSTISADSKHRGLGDNGMPAFDFSGILRSIPTLSQVPPMTEQRKITGKAAASAHEKPIGKRLKNLAEAIILQSIEDLWSKTYQKESIEFFNGEGFRHCADMAGISVVDRLRIIRLLRKVNAEAFTPRHTQKLTDISRDF